MQITGQFEHRPQFPLGRVERLFGCALGGDVPRDPEGADDLPGRVPERQFRGAHPRLASVRVRFAFLQVEDRLAAGENPLLVSVRLAGVLLREGMKVGLADGVLRRAKTELCDLRVGDPDEPPIAVLEVHLVGGAFQEDVQQAPLRIVLRLSVFSLGDVPHRTHCADAASLTRARRAHSYHDVNPRAGSVRAQNPVLDLEDAACRDRSCDFLLDASAVVLVDEFERVATEEFLRRPPVDLLARRRNVAITTILVMRGQHVRRQREDLTITLPGVSSRRARAPRISEQRFAGHVRVTIGHLLTSERHPVDEIEISATPSASVRRSSCGRTVRLPPAQTRLFSEM